MGGEIHRHQCDVPCCRCSPEAWHHGVKMCAAHWRKVSHEAFNALADAGKDFGKKEAMPAWETARASVIAEAKADAPKTEQISLI